MKTRNDQRTSRLTRGRPFEFFLDRRNRGWSQPPGVEGSRLPTHFFLVAPFHLWVVLTRLFPFFAIFHDTAPGCVSTGYVVFFPFLMDAVWGDYRPVADCVPCFFFWGKDAMIPFFRPLKVVCQFLLSWPGVDRRCSSSSCSRFWIFFLAVFLAFYGNPSSRFAPHLSL